MSRHLGNHLNTHWIASFRALRLAGQRVVWTNGFVVLAAVCYTAAEGQRAGRVSWSVVGVVTLGAWVAYLLDRLTDPPRRGAKAAWVRRMRGVAWCFCGVGTLAGGWLFFRWVPPRAELALAAAALLSAGYALPCWPRRGRWVRLRDLPYAKSIWVALAWALATSSAPLLAAGVGGGVLLSLGAERFLMAWAATIPFDVRDLQRDRRAGVKTLPMRLGVLGTALVCWTMLAVFVVLANRSAANDWERVALMAPAGLLALWLIGLRKKRADAYYSIGIDGCVVLQAVALWFVVRLS